MLRIYPVILEFLRAVALLIAVVETHDRDLAAVSVLREQHRAQYAGRSGSHGGTRCELPECARFQREAGACLDVAMALGYLVEVDEGVLKQIDSIRAVLAVLCR